MTKFANGEKIGNKYVLNFESKLSNDVPLLEEYKSTMVLNKIGNDYTIVSNKKKVLSVVRDYYIQEDGSILCYYYDNHALCCDYVVGENGNKILASKLFVQTGYQNEELNTQGINTRIFIINNDNKLFYIDNLASKNNFVAKLYTTELISKIENKVAENDTKRIDILFSQIDGIEFIEKGFSEFYFDINKGMKEQSLLVKNTSINVNEAVENKEDNTNMNIISENEEDALKRNNLKMLTESEIKNTNLKNNQNIKSVLTDEVPIPIGYKYIDGTKNTGVVISDSKNNEWVWIPANIEDMCIESTTTMKLDGDTGVTTKLYSKSEIVKGIKRMKVGEKDSYSAEKRNEPNLVVNKDTYTDDYYNYNKAGYNSLNEMAEGIVNEYEMMINSVKLYGGFYVGRYELTGTINVPREISGIPLVQETWYDLYKANKKFTTNNTTSGMIWGCQWDVICKWISENGDRIDIRKSLTWGNFSDATVIDNDGKILKEQGWENNRILNTGITNYTKANNIFDLAGNVAEMTMEVVSCDRASRGGRYTDFGQGVFKTDYQTPYSISNDGTRAMLIINPI